MQRVRIGLTGLAFVFLAVLLAAVFTRRPSNEAPITPNMIEQQQKGSAPATPMPVEPAADPLATMKLTPGDSEVNTAAVQSTPSAATPRVQR